MKKIALALLIVLLVASGSTAGFFGGGGGGTGAAGAGSGDVSKVGTPTNHQWGYWTGDGTLAGATITASKPICSNASGDPAVCAGTEGVWQVADAELSALAGLTSAANAIPYFTGSGTAGVISSSANMVSLLGSADYATARTNLGLGSGNDVSFKSVSTTAATTTGGYIRLMEGSDNGTDYSSITGAADAGSYPSFTFGGSQGSEDLVLTATNDLWTFSSTTGAKVAITPALTLTGGITSIGAAANLSGGTVTLGTVAGAINASSATSVAIPTASGPTVDAAGEIAIDTTSDQLVYYGGAKRVLPYKQFMSFVIAAPADTDDINLLKAPYGMTILAINCIVQGTTSVTGQLQECSATGGDCADLDSDITCDADGAADDGTLTDSAIASGGWLRWKTTSVSGTPTFLTVTVTYSVVSD